MRSPICARVRLTPFLAAVLLGPTASALDSALPGVDLGLDYLIVPADASVVPDYLLPVAIESAPEPAEPAVVDLLDVIGNGLVLPDSERKRIDQEFSWYVRHPDYLDRVFTRAQRYLPYIVEEIQRRGMPIDLALLPVVESAFDPFAYSHGRAAGLWQFIPGTGRLYGLEQDWWYDGRRDVVASTQAALDYLQALHDKLEGDWLLAVAAYNSGEGRVRSAVRRNRRAGKPTDFWHLKLPRETRAYVPKLLAISRVVARRHELGLVLPYVAPEPYFDEVALDGQIDLALAADFAGITLDEIYRLNPGFNRWATRPKGPHRLQVPVASRDAFTAALAAAPAEERVQWQRYRIRPGDTLSTIATRHHTTTATLRQANGLRGTTIRAGDHLMIPSSSNPLASYALSVDGRAQRRLERSGGVRYTVAPGDSFWTIARRYGVGTRQLASWNGMAPGDTLSVGRELIIRSPQKVPEFDTPSSGPAGAQRRVAYTVRRGDSLAKISSRFRVTVGQLVRWNKLDRNKYLQPGQRLVMYIDVTRQSGG